LMQHKMFHPCVIQQGKIVWPHLKSYSCSWIHHLKCFLYFHNLCWNRELLHKSCRRVYHSPGSVLVSLSL
jgi:hypothetical protein